jgi:hypothetical protein
MTVAAALAIFCAILVGIGIAGEVERNHEKKRIAASGAGTEADSKAA